MGRSVGSWRTRIVKPRKIADEPPLNREGFWKKREFARLRFDKDGRLVQVERKTT
jgi:hypothetical protein